MFDWIDKIQDLSITKKIIRKVELVATKFHVNIRAHSINNEDVVNDMHVYVARANVVQTI